MASTIKPRSPAELRQAVEWALNEGVTLDIRGSGAKLALGKPMVCDQVLDLSGLSGVVDYAPEELVVRFVKWLHSQPSLMPLMFQSNGTTTDRLFVTTLFVVP